MRESPETAASLVKKLMAALTDRGLAAEAIGVRMVWAANRAADPPYGDPRAAVLSPGLRQTVVCRTGDDGSLAWWWVWPGPNRDAQPDLELLGPAGDIEAAAERIAHVLRLGDMTGPNR